MRLNRYLYLFLAVVSLLAISLPAISASQSAKDRATKAYGQMPLSFIENRGQLDQRVKYVISGPQASAFFTRTGVTLDMIQRQTDPKAKTIKHVALMMEFAGASPECSVMGTGELSSKYNFMKGKDPSKWNMGIPTYKGVLYKNVWKGIDIAYRGEKRQLEYDIVVNPGAKVSDARIRYSGAEKVWLDKQGDLNIRTAVGSLIETMPAIYQEKRGKRINIQGGYKLLGNSTVGFSVKNADPSLPIIIDPITDLTYSTLLGGSGSDSGWGIAVDSLGAAYITGGTDSLDFPVTPGAFSEVTLGNVDVFVAKLNPSGSALEYCTLLGGNGPEFGYSIAVDALGSAYITGFTDSPDFPATNGAFSETLGGTEDGFVVKLNPTGSDLEYATYLGGESFDAGFAIAIDSLGNAYITGDTESSVFPTTAGAFSEALEGFIDAFVTKLNPSGSGLVYSTYLGGSDGDFDDGLGIAVDASGSAYVTGVTNATDFPTTPGAFNRSPAGFEDAFVVKLDPLGEELVYSTLLGGLEYDAGFGIAIDSAGNAYVTGDTQSLDFPTTLGAFETLLGGFQDSFVAKVNPSGSDLVYSTFLGGTDVEFEPAIAVDAFGGANITGHTYSTDFPTTVDPFNSLYTGDPDGFIVRIDPSGSDLAYSTYIGSVGFDGGAGIAVDASGSGYVTGQTGLLFPFPTTIGAFQTLAGGGVDAFIAKFNLLPRQPDILIKTGPEAVYSGQGIFSIDGNNQTKSQNALPGQRRTYLFRVRNAGIVNDAFLVTGTAGEPGWAVQYFDIATNTDITAQVTGAGFPTGTLAPGTFRGLYVYVTPNGTVPAGGIKTLLITAASVNDPTSVDVVKAVTTNVTPFTPDLLIKTGPEVAYSGQGIFSIDGNNQTKSQNASPNQRMTYLFRARNGGTVSDSFRINGTGGGAGWSVQYFEIPGNTNITAQVISGAGYTTGALAPGAIKGIYVYVTADSTVLAGAVKTLLVSATSLGDVSRRDVVKAETTLVPTYRPDMLIKTGPEAAYSGTGIFSADGVNQTKTQTAITNQKRTFLFRAKNAGNTSESLTVTGTAGENGWTVTYFELPGNTDITAQVTGGGFDTGVLAPGTYRGLYVTVTPDGTVPVGTDMSLLITTISTTDITKLDVVRAVTEKL